MAMLLKANAPAAAKPQRTLFNLKVLRRRVEIAGAAQ